MPRAGQASTEVDSLFQAHSIQQIREEEAQTRRHIEEKKKQLRHVVGDSYRDLISSADTIIDISRSCHRVVGMIDSLQRGLADVAASVEARRGTPQEQAASSYDCLYALGSQVKFLVDSPEAIYGCLDAGDYLAAARRFVRCLDIHKGLSAHPKQISQRFPLLLHQWPLVRKLKGQIQERAIAWLGVQGEVSAGQVAAVLASLALLQPMDGAELLKTYLTARQAYLTQILTDLAASQETDPGSLSVILADLACHVCATVAQCGELFLPLPGLASVPLLLRLLSMRASSEAGPGSDLPLELGSAEAAAWAAHQSAVQSRLADLSTAGVALECSQWLDTVSAQLRGAGGRLLASCANGADLLAVEHAVRVALENWQYMLRPVKVKGSEDAAAGASTMPGAQVPAAEAVAATMAWSDVCQWVLAQPVSLWQLLLEVPLLERAKQLVGAGFTSVVDEVAALVDAALAAAGALPPSPPGSYQLETWSELAVLQPGTPEPVVCGKRRQGSRQQGAGTGGEAEGAAMPSGSTAAAKWLQRVEQVLQVFDQQLKGAHSAALDTCYGQQQQQGPGARVGAGATGPAAARRPSSNADASAGVMASSRVLVLEPFVQERCTEAVGRIVGLLRSRIEALPATPGASDGEVASAGAAAFAPTAHQALVLGRVALSIADRSQQLPVILGPPQLWSTRSSKSSLLAAGQLAGIAASRAAPASPQLEALRCQYHALGTTAYRLWADWAAAGLAATLVAAWAADCALAADAPLRSWEDTVIVAGGEGAGGDAAGADGISAGTTGGEMRFALPASPSPAAMMAALGACQEAGRAGGQCIDAPALWALKWQLEGAVLSTTRAALVRGGSLAQVLSEKGALQLLFDLRFLHTLLAGPPSPPPDRPDKESCAGTAATAVGATAARQQEVEGLEEELSGRVDPIDWATYESYLHANQQRFKQRCQVLFGLLARLDDVSRGDATPTAAPTVSSSATDSNMLLMAAPGPRFAYLPAVAQPQRTTPGALAPASSTTNGAAAGIAAALAGESAATESYSFASMGSGRHYGSSLSSTRGSGAAAAAAAASSSIMVGSAGSALDRARALGSSALDRAAAAMGEYRSGAGLLSSLALPSFTAGGSMARR